MSNVRSLAGLSEPVTCYRRVPLQGHTAWGILSGKAFTTVCAQTVCGLNFRKWRLFTIFAVFIFTLRLDIIIHTYSLYMQYNISVVDLRKYRNREERLACRHGR